MTGKTFSVFIHLLYQLQNIYADPYIVTHIKTHSHISNVTIYFNHISENLDFTLNLEKVAANLDIITNEVIPFLEQSLGQSEYEGKIMFELYSQGLLKTLKGCQKNSAIIKECIDSDKQPNPEDPNLIDMINDEEFKQDVLSIKNFVSEYQAHLTGNKVDDIQRVSQIASKISVTAGGLVEIIKSFIKQRISLQQYLFLRNKVNQPNLDEKNSDFDINLDKCDSSYHGLRCFGQVEKFTSGENFAYLKPLIHDLCYVNKEIFLSSNNLVEANCFNRDRCVITNTRKTSQCLEALWNQNYDSIIESCPLTDRIKNIQNHPFFSGVIINQASEFISNQIKELFASYNSSLPIVLSYTGKFKLGKEPQSLEIVRGSTNRLIYQNLPENISICPSFANHPIVRMLHDYIVSPYLAIVAGIILSLIFVKGYTKYREIRERRKRRRAAQENLKVMLVRNARPRDTNRQSSNIRRTQ